MPTINQKRRCARKAQKPFVSSPGLQRCPQRRGRIQKLLVLAPRKPNSARRKAVKLRMTTGRYLIARLTGSGGLPLKFGIVLVRGKGAKDTPNAKYTVIRGALECMPLFTRKSRRSKYGVKKE